MKSSDMKTAKKQKSTVLLLEEQVGSKWITDQYFSSFLEGVARMTQNISRRPDAKFRLSAVTTKTTVRVVASN